MKYLIIFIFIFILFPAFVDSEVPIHFAITSGEDGLARFHQWNPLINYLETVSGFPIILEILKDHTAILKGMDEKRIDFAFVNPLWYDVIDKNNQHTSLVRNVIQDKDWYCLHLIVHRDSIFLVPGNLAEMKIALVDPADSKADYHIARTLLEENGFPDFDTGQFIYTDTDLSILKGIVYGEVKAGFINSTVLMNQRNSTLAAQIRVLRVSEPIPQWTVITRKDMQARKVNVITRYFLTMDDVKEGKMILDAAGFDCFVKAEKIDTKIMQKYFAERKQIVPSE